MVFKRSVKLGKRKPSLTEAKGGIKIGRSKQGVAHVNPYAGTKGEERSEQGDEKKTGEEK